MKEANAAPANEDTVQSMTRFSAIALIATLITSSALLGLACGEDSPAIAPTGADASTSTSKDGGTTEGEDASEEPEDAGAKEAAPGDTCVGKYEAPNLNGSGPCGTDGFGEPAAGFGPVDVDGGTTYTGTALADGIYDAVNAERASANGGSWRETFVVKGNRFTRIRQVDTGTGSGPGAISYRSGTYAYDTSGTDQTIKLTFDCAQTGDAGADAGSDTLPSDAVVADDCSARYRYGASGIRITLRRR